MATMKDVWWWQGFITGAFTIALVIALLGVWLADAVANRPALTRASTADCR